MRCRPLGPTTPHDVLSRSWSTEATYSPGMRRQTPVTAPTHPALAPAPTLAPAHPASAQALTQAPAQPAPAEPIWKPDILGPGYACRTLDLLPDDEGDVVATLIRHQPIPGAAPPPDSGLDVLYVHGWSDYFFQTELADFWDSLGARFYAVDLRKYGRSLRPGQTPGFVDDLATYDEEIEAALTAMGHGLLTADEPKRDRKLILMGHSTGGLTLSLWAARNPGRAHGLVLNSPWLEFQAGERGRSLLSPVIDVEAGRRPHATLPKVDLGFYTRAVSRQFEGEWEYNLQWRPERGFPAASAWLAAVLRGHATVARGLGIDIPILVLLSTRSTLGLRWSEDMLHTDTAVDVAGVARRSLDLGTFTTISRIEGALHDVVLSAPPVRAVAYDHLSRWTSAFIHTPERHSSTHSRLRRLGLRRA